MNCIIVCAGDFYEKEFLSKIKDGAFIIAADAGYSHLKRLGIAPDLFIGDCDSLGYVPAENCIKLPCEKDNTDSFEAVSEAVKRGYKEITLFGALGGNRFSHSIANMQMLLGFRKKGVSVTVCDEKCRIRVIANETAEYGKDMRGTISFFAAEGECVFDIDGLKYPLSEKTVSPDYPLCVSNETVGVDAKVTVRGYAFEIVEM